MLLMPWVTNDLQSARIFRKVLLPETSRRPIFTPCEANWKMTHALAPEWKVDAASRPRDHSTPEVFLRKIIESDDCYTRSHGLI